jgi:hypothetical protein
LIQENIVNIVNLMESEFERKKKGGCAHSFETKQRTEDVKTREKLSFSDMHISRQVLEGLSFISIKF